jgi:Domain of unknown function (DUF6378)
MSDPVKRIVVDLKTGSPIEGQEVLPNKILDYRAVVDNARFEETIEDVTDLLKMSGPCSEAIKLVYGDRNKSYGEPLDDMGRTAKLFSAVLGIDVTAEQVAMCMICVKLSRLCNSLKPDSVVDIAGYAETIYRMQEERKRREGVTSVE